MQQDWREHYHSKIVSAEKAVQSVQSGDAVWFHCACSEPSALVRALVNRAPELKDVQIYHMTSLGEAEYTKAEYQGHFRHKSLFCYGATRKAVNENRADFIPVRYSDVPRLITDGVLPIDAVFLMVSPPDQDGWCSFGLTADYAKAAAETAKTVIVQVNRNMPHTGGEKLHLDHVTWIVEEDEPLFQLPRPKVGEIERTIAGNVARLISDGATLQLGIGAIPDTVLSALTNRKGLGIHSEMFSDGVVDLYESGAITNENKGIDRGKFVATFLMGTQRLFDFVDHNPAVELRTVDYVNDPWVIGQNPNMVSVNSALQIDLTGQINAETIGPKHFSGIGGQVDFIEGSWRSKGGRSVIALPATAAGGKVSRIVNVLSPGAAVTTSRGIADYIVTEYGIAEMKGKSLSERAHALIAIAHPDFRETLLREAEEIGRYL